MRAAASLIDTPRNAVERALIDSTDDKLNAAAVELGYLPDPKA